MRHSTTTCRDAPRRGLAFRPAAPRGTGGQYPPPRRSGVATRCVTPRQTCPPPNGFGRNLRSKTRWFTGFCNSHQVSHFATFFIDARAEISVAESRFDYDRRRDSPPAHRGRGWGDGPSFRVFLGAFRAGVGLSPARRARGGASGREGEGLVSAVPRRPAVTQVRGSSVSQDSTMILPQVHLRKPCYDFSFL